MNKIKTISCDIETFSSVDLQKCGVYKYASSPDFEILLFGYSVDGGPVKIIDLAQGEKIPDEIINALYDENVQKWSYNNNFERVCLSSFVGMPVGKYFNPKSWYCSMVWSAYLGLPLSLKGVGSVLKLDEQKMTEGKDLIKYFCCPCAPTKTNGGRTRNLPHHAPDKWETFKAYNKRDVEVEMAIQSRLRKFPVPDFVWDEYHIDQEINDRGVLIDKDFVLSAIDVDYVTRSHNTQELQKLTGLVNPNSVIQMRDWLKEQGIETDGLDKKTISALLPTVTDDVKRVLELRQQLAKSSVKKYQAMQNAICSDGRARGMFMFYGANRTGRYAGRLIQLHNLPQNHLDDIKKSRKATFDRNLYELNKENETIPDILSQLIRTAFIPKDGCKFIVSDFSAIEARVIAWLAGEQWVMDTFANNGDIYCETASRMFHVPVEKHGINGELRQKGKQCTLSCSYGGSVGALKAMGAIEAGMKEDELQPLVDAWRNANPNITKLWWDVGDAAMKAVKERIPSEVHGIGFEYKSGMLFITLPSGRCLSYVKPHIGVNKFGSECITYEGIGATKKWERLETYGPKLVGNIVQGIARDILCYTLKNFRTLRVVMTVHDEVVIEAPKPLPFERVCKAMSKTPPWAEGLLLRADGYECEFYRKD